MKKISLKLTVLAGVLSIAAAGGAYVFTRVPQAPEVTFKTLAGEAITTAQLKGKVTLVNFWATSCVTCVAEMPKIVQTHEKFKARGFETIAVAMQYDPPNYVLKFAENRKLPFKVALDVDGSVARGFEGVRLTPTTFIVDKRGRIIKQFLGEPKWDDLYALLDKALAEPG